MERRKIFWALTFVLGFLLQIPLSNAVSFYGAVPNFLLLGTIFFAFYGGPVRGQLIGFGWGLLFDAATLSLFGSEAFLLCLIGYVCGRMQRKVDEEKALAQVTLVFFFSLAHYLGVAFFERLFGSPAPGAPALPWMLAPLYTTLAGPAVFWCLARWCDLFGRPGLAIPSEGRGGR